MKKVIIASALALAVFSIGCGAPATNTANTNTNGGGGPAAPVTVEALKALEVKAFEAYKAKDTKYFETFLDRNFVAYEGGKKIDKAAVLKMIGENKDEIKGFTFSEEKLTKLGPVTAMLTMKAVTDGTRDGKKLPDVISSTLYTRIGTDWRAAWHGEVEIASAPPADDKTKPADKATPGKLDAPKGPAETKPIPPPPADKKEANSNTAAPAADPATDALMSAEKAGWEAWMAKDWAKLGPMMTTEVVFVDPTGVVTAGRDANIKAWTDMKCEIKSVSVTDGTSVSVTGDTSILFANGSANGTCAGEKMAPVGVTAIYLKEGADWKLAYHFETAGR